MPWEGCINKALTPSPHRETIMLFKHLSLNETPLEKAMTDAYHMDEAQAADRLIDYARFTSAEHNKAKTLAKQLAMEVRSEGSDRSGIEAFMYHYDLSCEEGILLMCLAEALLRIPDKETEKLLIKDKLTSAAWESHLGSSASSFVNAATWGLALTGKLLQSQDNETAQVKNIWHRMLKRSGEPVIRKAIRQVMKVLSQQFVVGRTIEEALSRSKKQVKQGYSYSYDMLGEAARTQADADAYMVAYQNAIRAIGKARKGDVNIFHGPSISVKLSALYPRYEFATQESCVPYLIDRLKTLAIQARESHMSLTVDAEESYRLDISLKVIEAVFAAPELADWDGLGLAVQAYQKRGFYVIDRLIDMARRYSKRLQVRLVKGAYWDTEIKIAQVEGYREYPVFTRKVATDVSYIACAKKLLNAHDVIYSQFATHNAYSVAAIITMVGDRMGHMDFEFQNLQGMGTALHDHIVDKHQFNLPSRIYAPVGVHEDLLPYLVRRLLENGANTSFVNQVADDDLSLDELLEDPMAKLAALPEKHNTKLPLPYDLYGADRKNSKGLDLTDMALVRDLDTAFAALNNKTFNYGLVASTNPSNRSQTVGTAMSVDADALEVHLTAAHNAFHAWSRRDVKTRADILRKAAELMEARRDELMFMAVKEAGKTLPDAIAEVREAIDFFHYYAMMAELSLSKKTLTGPTGETNELYMQGRGVMACISPWNFPVAIFAGQVAAALVSGNCVIAKPAGQTPLCALLVCDILYAAGVPRDVLHCTPGSGRIIGAKMAEDDRIAGIMFTGSTEVAKSIQMSLAKREGPIVPFIAETGGMNAMIADSSALHEQLVEDVIRSAFGSAGQRCSALRILYVQDDIGDDVIAMLKGAMSELNLDDPMFLSTDIGPVIDESARDELVAHAIAMDAAGELIAEVKTTDQCEKGSFFAPRAYLLKDASILKREVFGPILHIVRYPQSGLNDVIKQINDFGYGLTFGVHSRIADTVNHIVDNIEVGNVYVNRNMIGAVVGVQPFGGCKLSGTGPKAGGPHYLLRLSDEKTVTINTTAAGGNASLMAMGD
jgi:RHH-type transcriptional regulator, proline utilization regulon repressor / proline dehydrogenase / delta 1-pyrroline-5-carboxylate dehydrogenase